VETPLIATNARKHGVHDDDMIHAFNHPKFVDDQDDGFVMFVGADTSGNLLEIGVIESVDGPIIIHAMTARPKYLR
jgi:hypothetical protein